MAVSIGELEAIAAKGWRAPDEERLGGWLLRAAQGFTGRANGALAQRLGGAVEVYPGHRRIGQ